MDSMDLKGIAWVGNIYQKFEAMCMEVEEAMCQETAKYVENQVQTVGASMKRFCSDVMQDVIPPSSKDLSRVASSDLLLNPYLEFGIHKKSTIKEDTTDSERIKGISGNKTFKIHRKPISTIKEDAKDSECVKGISAKKTNSSNDVWEDWSAASFDWEISDKDEEKCDWMAMKVTNRAEGCESRGGKERQIRNLAVEDYASFGSRASRTAVVTKSSGKGGKRSRQISSNNIIRAECTDTSENRGMIPKTGSEASSITSNSHSKNGDVFHTEACENSGRLSLPQTGANVVSNMQSGEFVGEDISRSHIGSSADCDSDLEQENSTGVQAVEAVEDGSESESRFEETCVLVDGNDYCPVTQKEEIRRSYKKKIQSAFSLKKKSGRKQEYKQLAAEYGNINEEAIDLSKNTKSKKISPHDSLDSEWELL